MRRGSSEEGEESDVRTANELPSLKALTILPWSTCMFCVPITASNWGGTKAKRVAFVHLLLVDGRQADLPLRLDASRQAGGLLSEEQCKRTKKPATCNCRRRSCNGRSASTLCCAACSLAASTARMNARLANSPSEFDGEGCWNLRGDTLPQHAVAIFSDQVSQVQDVTSGAMLRKQRVASTRRGAKGVTLPCAPAGQARHNNRCSFTIPDKNNHGLASEKLSGTKKISSSWQAGRRQLM